MRIDKFINSIRNISAAFLSNGCFNRASSLSYASLLTIVPMLTVVLTLLTKFPGMNVLEEKFEGFIFDHLIAASGQTIQYYLNQFVAQAFKLSWIGISALFITVITLMWSVESAFNTIWNIEMRSKNILKSLLRHWLFLIVLPLLLGSSIILSSYLYSLSLIKGVFNLLNIDSMILSVLPNTIIFVMMLCLYKYIPAAKVSYRGASAGALFTTALFALSKKLFTLYMSWFPTYKILYGAFAAIPLFLLWTYIAWVIVLLGAEITRYIDYPPQKEAR
jgi:membrane protein